MRLKKYRGIGHLCFKFSAEEFGLFFYKPHIPRFPANCGLGWGRESYSLEPMSSSVKGY